MLYEKLTSSPNLLELIKIAIFVGLFTFSATYLMPKGITAYFAWKESKEYKKLVTGVNFILGATFILIYLISTMIISHIKTVFE